jgi:hypothetical protein
MGGLRSPRRVDAHVDYDKRYGYKKLIPNGDESQTGTPNDIVQTFAQ